MTVATSNEALMSQIIVETPRILACLWHEDEAALLKDLHSTHETSGYITGEGPWSHEKALLKLQKYRSEHEEDGTGKYKIILKRDGSFIGRAGVSAYDKQAGEYELGYVLKKAHWGQGLATEIARAMTNRFFKLGLSNRLIAFSDHWNRPSHQVLQKIGMLNIGSRLVGGSETLEFSIFDSDWKSRVTPTER
ncbi:GNAT family N-acetyltransferase [Rhizobium laguerreae]|uniref:GNAT family N-acetyltransferase n=1 Tax=Rhizobium laguerreae TaxID=1076926 RepID=UPI001C904761|nr:GNAT family N-acetyltransferase [Rhizobium laguerreae]MBY3151401.1 GNAT family N-acetyltransferase [Rhizobium laguerreae]